MGRLTIKSEIFPDDYSVNHNALPNSIIGTAQKVTEMAVNKLGKLEDLEEQGLLLKLPCKFGEKLFVIEDISDLENASIYEYTFDGIANDGLRLMFENMKDDICVFEFNEIGKIIFTTRAEAEKALKELR